MKRKDFEKFAKRNTHKRKAKDAAKSELLKIAEKYGSSVSVRDVYDSGRGGRVSTSPHRDETTAEGIYSSSRQGFGFVALAEGGRDIFIPEGKSQGALDGDLVEVIYHKYENRFGEEKTEGRVKKILSYGRKTLIGTVEEDYRRYGRRRIRVLRLIPDDGRFYPYPEISDARGAIPKDKVEVKLIRTGYAPECEVLRSFGSSESFGANYEAILAEENIEVKFDPEAQKDAEIAARAELSDEGRVNREREVIFTMDGADALDLDDAVSLVRTRSGGYKLGVHIADVSHYVKEKTALDRAAMSRATSVYFTDKVVPMLPKALSNGACSLNAGERKYTLSAIIKLSAEGEILDLSLEESVIRSRVRGVYSEVNELLSGSKDSALRAKYREVLPTLKKMEELCRVLNERRRKRSYIDFDTDEAKIILDGSGAPVDIVLRERGLAERMIEEFMLIANEAVAKYLSDREIPCVYRIHETPPPDRYSELVRFAHNLGFSAQDIDSGDPCAEKLAALLKKAEERGVGYPLSYMMLRSMAKAKYSDVRSRHFGLGLDYYCHFTSPIRRLSDLATHRIIKAHLHGVRTEKYKNYAKRAAAAATEGELRALAAERRIDELYKTLYMSRFIGECFDAEVCSVTSFGMFVRLENTVEGLVPMSEMPGEFFFDEGNMSLVSRGGVFRLADRLCVRLEECDITRGNLRFSVV